MGHPAFAHLRSVLETKQGMPIAWQNSLAVLLGIVFSVGLGVLLDTVDGGQTVVVSVITGMFLSLIAVAGPFFMALRLVVGIGILMVLTSGLAIVAADHAWLAIAGMVVLVFVGTVWTAIPLVGALLGTFPIIGYLLFLAKGQSLSGGAHPGRVMLAAVAGVLGAVLVLVVLSGRDPRKASRRLVARAWDPKATWSQQGAILSVLRLDAAPRALVSLTQTAILAMIARSWLDQERDAEAYAAGLQAQGSLAKTLPPRGRIVPRTVEPPIADARAQLRTASKAAGGTWEGYAWDRWEVALDYGEHVLDGSTAPRRVTFSSISLTGALVRSVLHPQAASFRYGVQRAVALGIATYIMVGTTTPDFYWVLLTMFSVMQTNAIATLSRAAQYAFGTWIGAVGALALSLVVPPGVVTVLALGLLVAGFAWMTRNYMVMCVAMAAAVVLMVGAPDGDYLMWAGLRALDVTVGAVIAIVVSAFVLRVRPEPDLHVTQARDALVSTAGKIRRRLQDPEESTELLLADEGQFLWSTSNLKADIQLLRDSSVASEQLDQLRDANDRLLALASVVFQDDARTPEAKTLIDKGLTDIETRIRHIGTTAAPAR